MSRFEKHLKIISWAAIAGLLVLSEVSQAEIRTPAAIPRRSDATDPNNVDNHYATISPELIEAYEQTKSVLQPYDYSQVVPTNLQAGMDTRVMASRFADKNLQNWWNSAEVQSTAVAQTLVSTEKKLRPEIIIGEKEKTQHKINLQVDAFDTKARIDYSGFLKAAVFYFPKEFRGGVEIADRIFAQEIVLTHEESPANNLSRVSLYWNW